MAKKRRMSGGTESAYKDFLLQVELYAIGLDSIHADLNRAEYSDALAADSASLSYSLKPQFRLDEFDADHFDVAASFELVAHGRDDKDFLTIKGVFSAHIHPRSGTFDDRRNAERFSNAEARLLFWPYFRQAIADVTARMHIRPLTIPFTFRPQEDDGNQDNVHNEA